MAGIEGMAMKIMALKQVQCKMLFEYHIRRLQVCVWYCSALPASDRSQVVLVCMVGAGIASGWIDCAELSLPATSDCSEAMNCGCYLMQVLRDCFFLDAF